MEFSRLPSVVGVDCLPHTMCDLVRGDVDAKTFDGTCISMRGQVGFSPERPQVNDSNMVFCPLQTEGFGKPSHEKI